MSAETSITESLSPAGKPPKRRVKDATAMLAIADKYDEQDSVASQLRARVDAMVNGAPPWNPRELREKGMGSVINENFGEAKAILDAAVAPYIELIDSVPRVADITLDLQDPEESNEKSMIASEEWDWFCKNWDDYTYNIMQVQKGFVGDGISVAAFPDERGVFFTPVLLKDFKIARDTPASDQQIKIAAVWRSMDVAELYDYIKNPQVARDLGWNVDAVKDSIWKASATSSAWKNSFSHWEEFEREIKENDMYCAEAGYEKARLCYGYVREFAQGGNQAKYTQVIASKDSTDFLYERFGKFDNINQCFVLFTYGIGSGTFHTIRGLKHDIYGHIQISNRLVSQAIQGALLSMQVVLQGSAKDIQDFQMLEMGPYSLIPMGITPTQITPPNISNEGVAAYNLMQRMIQNNTGSYQARAITPDDQARSATEVRASMIQQNVLGSAAMSLFHTPYSKLHREMFRRAVSPILSQRDAGGRLAYEFRARCLKRGVTNDDLRTFSSVRTVRSLGNGSAQLQQQAADTLFAISSAFDEPGRIAALREKVASIPGIGFSRASEFVVKTGPRMLEDFDIANNEHAGLVLGIMPIITSEQRHYSHLQAHIPFLAATIERFKNQEISEDEAIKILGPGGDHATEHVVLLSENSTMQAEAADMRRQLQNVMAFVKELQQQVLNRMMAEQGQMEGQAAEGGMSAKEQYELQKLQLEIQKKQADFEASQQEHQQKMEAIRQKMALDDAKTSSQIAGSIPARPVGRPTLVD
jgi:hypothetical protein